MVNRLSCMKDRDALFPALQLRGQGIVLRKRTREEPTKLKHATSWEIIQRQWKIS